MTDLLDLLTEPEPERFARTSDPKPSKVAAERGDSYGPLTVRVLRTLIEVERTCPRRVGANTAELQMRMAYDSEATPDRNSISRRLTSLLRKGFVRAASTAPVRSVGKV